MHYIHSPKVAGIPILYTDEMEVSGTKQLIFFKLRIQMLYIQWRLNLNSLLEAAAEEKHQNWLHCKNLADVFKRVLKAVGVTYFSCVLPGGKQVVSKNFWNQL